MATWHLQSGPATIHLRESLSVDGVRQPSVWRGISEFPYLTNTAYCPSRKVRRSIARRAGLVELSQPA